LALISGGPNIDWHTAALATGDPKPFGEGCRFDVDAAFAQNLERIASAGVIEMRDPDAPLPMVEIAVFEAGQPVLQFGGGSDVLRPGEVAFRLDERIYLAVKNAVDQRARAEGCF